jgi:putative FmdB family regulatory protein
VPIYSFSCANCGPFDLTRPMTQATEPAWCSRCGGEASRVLTPPGLAILARSVRGALELEEKSATEPEAVSKMRGRPMRRTHTPTPPWVLGG